MWGHFISDSKVHLIKWDTINKPKKIGDVGLKNYSNVNAVFMAKLKWDLATNSNKPWVILFLNINTEFLPNTTKTLHTLIKVC